MGLKAIIAPSFADIFKNNCAKIGLLTVELPQDSIDRLIARAEDSPGWEMEVDLETQTVSLSNGKSRQFEIDPFVKHCLLNGLDDVSLTLQEDVKIASFEAGRPSFLPRTPASAS
jgi:3-isopropylmalate/(R)-2-methylmalate dehydratase small subunit